jgi:hypothetical protein
LQGKKYDPRDHPMGTGLEYSYLEVTDDDTEGKQSSRCSDAASTLAAKTIAIKHFEWFQEIVSLSYRHSPAFLSNCVMCLRCF